LPLLNNKRFAQQQTLCSTTNALLKKQTFCSTTNALLNNKCFAQHTLLNAYWQPFGLIGSQFWLIGSQFWLTQGCKHPDRITFESEILLLKPEKNDKMLFSGD
jgi:hypothetical protein